MANIKETRQQQRREAFSVDLQDLDPDLRLFEHEAELNITFRKNQIQSFNIDRQEAIMLIIALKDHFNIEEKELP
jgi:hypothetical protein